MEPKAEKGKQPTPDTKRSDLLAPTKGSMLGSSIQNPLSAAGFAAEFRKTLKAQRPDRVTDAEGMVIENPVQPGTRAPTLGERGGAFLTTLMNRLPTTTYLTGASAFGLGLVAALPSIGKVVPWVAQNLAGGVSAESLKSLAGLFTGFIILGMVNDLRRAWFPTKGEKDQH